MKKIRHIFLLIAFVLGCVFQSCSKKNLGENVKVIDCKPEVFIGKIDSKLNETSGLIWFDNRLWSVNDGGNKDEIYALDADGDIRITVELDDAKNTDWEAMTQDDKYIYVGDFGNNLGIRKDLKVFRISKKKLYDDKEKLKVKAKKIKFSYAFQKNFFPRNHAHQFDCEAMFSYKDHLYLFSKDWVSFDTELYKLPKKPGEYELKPEGRFDVRGLITGAALSPDEKYFSLIGYLDSVPFIYLFKFDPANIFSKKAVYLDLKTIAGSQTEGICFINDSTLVFSTEKTSSYSQKVFSINWINYKTFLD